MSFDIGVKHKDVKYAGPTVFRDRFCQHRDGPVSRGTIPLGTKYPSPADIDVAAFHRFLVKRKMCNLPIDHYRFEQYQKPPSGKRAEPAIFIIGVFLVVISLNSDDRDAGVFEFGKTLNSVIHRFRRHRTFMKKVAAHYYKIHIFTDSIPPNHIDPRIKKVARTFGKLVSRAA